MKPKALGKVFYKAFTQWQADKAQRMGAALAFYTVFSLSPLLIVVIAVAGYLFGQSAAQGQIIFQIETLIGHAGAEAISVMIDAARRPAAGLFATVVGIATLLIGATGALFELQDGLNRIWKAPEAEGLLTYIRQRLVSFALILVIAFLLLVSLVISTVLSLLGTFLQGRFPLHQFFWQSADFLLSWIVITVLFAMIYKILPDVLVKWGDVWTGAAVASILFTIGKFIMGFYIGKSAIASTYGAAGSFVVVLMWVYYSSLIFYHGAEFTKAYADRFGSRLSSKLS